MKEENCGSFFPQRKALEALTKFAFLTMRRNEYDSERTPIHSMEMLPMKCANVLSLKNESLTILAA
jgi:hypothetical protein